MSVDAFCHIRLAGNTARLRESLDPEEISKLLESLFADMETRVLNYKEYGLDFTDPYDACIMNCIADEVRTLTVRTRSGKEYEILAQWETSPDYTFWDCGSVSKYAGDDGTGEISTVVVLSLFDIEVQRDKYEKMVREEA